MRLNYIFQLIQKQRRTRKTPKNQRKKIIDYYSCDRFNKNFLCEID